MLLFTDFVYFNYSITFYVSTRRRDHNIKNLIYL